MKILSHSYKDYPVEGWNIPTIEFKDLNLIVGISGAGKTRLLNTISNIKGIVSNGFTNRSGGSWDLILQENGQNYHWQVIASPDDHGKTTISREYLSIIGDKTEKQILKRDDNFFPLPLWLSGCVNTSFTSPG